MYVYSNQADYFTATISGIPHPGLSYENGSLVDECNLFISLRFVMVNLTFPVIGAHHEHMHCNDCMRAVTGFISRLG